MSDLWLEYVFRLAGCTLLVGLAVSELREEKTWTPVFLIAGALLLAAGYKGTP